jgi:hypothetical protein
LAARPPDAAPCAGTPDRAEQEGRWSEKRLTGATSPERRRCGPPGRESRRRSEQNRGLSRRLAAAQSSIRLHQTRRDGQSPKAPLEPAARDAYCPRMAETSPGTPAPAGWHESLSRSKAQIAAGESVPLLPVLDRLRASAERLEAEQGITADGAEAPAGR